MTTRTRTGTQHAIWKDFTHYKETYAEVERRLHEGQSVVAVLVTGTIGLGLYDGIDPLPEVMKIKDALENRGASLPIGQDGLLRLAFLAWKKTDTIDQPSDLAVVAVAAQADDDGMLKVDPRWFGFDPKRFAGKLGSDGMMKIDLRDLGIDPIEG